MLLTNSHKRWHYVQVYRTWLALLQGYNVTIWLTQHFLPDYCCKYIAFTRHVSWRLMQHRLHTNLYAFAAFGRHFENIMRIRAEKTLGARLVMYRAQSPKETVTLGLSYFAYLRSISSKQSISSRQSNWSKQIISSKKRISSEKSNWRKQSPGGGVLRSIFVGYMPLASQNPYPIIVIFYGQL